MGLYLVGENIDKTRSHYQAGKGKLIQLMRGLYVDADDDIEATIQRHAVRIANYLYPNTYLSAVSAVLLGPTRDGRLFLSGRRTQRTRIRSLEIIQNQAPDNPSTGFAIVDDGLGEFRVNVSSIRQRFLESFRLRSEHAASIDETTRSSIAARLIEEYRSEKAAADAIWALARENQWYREGEHAERFLLRTRQTQTTPKNEAAIDLIVAWHGEQIGNLVHDGFEWQWTASNKEGTALVRQTIPGKLPPFIISLLPEGWLETVLQNHDERKMLRSGKRYMSNITIVEQKNDLSSLPSDVLHTPLNRYASEGIFTGTYAGPGRSDIEKNFEQNLAQIFESSETPRLSGVQIKAPMHLGVDGILSPSIGTPFTHIFKPAGTSGFELLPLIEWMSLTLGKGVGFQVPAIALINMPDGMHPALLVERFDIRQSERDFRRLALEDFCSVLDLPTEAKYSGTIERIARAIRPVSTSPEIDLMTLTKRALFAWLIADGDMHLKNMALLKIIEPGDGQFSSVRIAPLYDAVTTRVFPRLKNDRMALKLNGQETLRRKDFTTLASTIGLKISEVNYAIDETIDLLKVEVGNIRLPKLSTIDSEALEITNKMLEICFERISQFE